MARICKISPHSVSWLQLISKSIQILLPLPIILLTLVDVLLETVSLRAECTNPSYETTHNLVLNASQVTNTLNGSLNANERVMHTIVVPKDGTLTFQGSCSRVTEGGIFGDVGSTHLSTVGTDQCWGYVSYTESHKGHSFGMCRNASSTFTKTMYVGKQTLYIDLHGGWESGGGNYQVNISFEPALANSTETEWNDSPETADPITGSIIRGSVGFANKRDLSSVVNLSNSEITHDPADWFTGQVGDSGKVSLSFARIDNLGQGSFTWDNVTISLIGELSNAGGTISDSKTLLPQGNLELIGLDPGSQYYISVATKDESTWWWPWPWQFGAYTIDFSGVNTSPNMLLMLIPVIIGGQNK